MNHDAADRVLGSDSGVVEVRLERPLDRWPAAYFVLVRAAASRGSATRTLEGTLVARVGAGDRLFGGQQLQPGEFIQAKAEACRLTFQTDGNLVAYKKGVAYWSAGTVGASPGLAAMQSDGNFVVYYADGVVRWSTGTGGNTGAYLAIENDCNVVLRAANNVALWSSGRP